MDNASKALIMAGAILLAVAIVGLGVYLFSLSQGLIDTAESSLNGLSIDLQNNELLKYEGSIKGAQVRQLINKVNYLKNDWPIVLSYADNQDHSSSDVESGGKLYTVSFGIDEDTGYVETVTISGITDASH